MLIANVAIILLGSIGIIMMLAAQNKRKQLVVQSAYEHVREEADIKKGILLELMDVAAGMVSPEAIKKAKADQQAAEIVLVEERGRVAVAEAELQTIEVRLRELEELERELEASSVDAMRELELMKEQEQRIKEETDKLRQTLNNSMQKLDDLLEQLSSSQSAVEKLTAVKTELVNTESKIDFYVEGISQLNARYLDLKKAYDALDIEYAQLYERQNSVL